MLDRDRNISSKARAAALIAVVVIASIHASRANALDATKDFAQYAIRNWQAEDGLQQDQVNALTQTPDGYLWIGTQRGLVRFDGIRFTPVILGESHKSEITDLHVSH